MRRNILILLLALMLSSASAMATDTRVLTMGDNNMVLLDEANIRVFPSRVYEYPNLAIGQFGGDDFQELGIHWKFGTDNPWVLGTYFSKMAIGQPTGFYDGTPFGHFTEDLDLTNERIDLFYGRPNLIANHNFGFHFGYIRASYDHEDLVAAEDYKEKIYYYDFGFGLTEANGDYDAAVHIAFGGWTDEGVNADDTGVVQSEPDGFMDLVAVFRKFRQINPEWTAIFHAGLNLGKRGVKDHGADAGPVDWSTKNDLITKDSRFSLDAGLGANWTPATNVLVVGDVGIAYESVKREETWTTAYSTPAGSQEMTKTDIIFPYWSIGFDADVFKWLDIRMGARSWWIAGKNEEGGDFTEKYRLAVNDTYLGFGFHWGRLHIDTQTDPDLFLRGFDFITGNGGDDDMNAQISAAYELM